MSSESGQEEEVDEFDQPMQEESVSVMEEETQQKSKTMKKLQIQQSEQDKQSATYVFIDEDHTLGNMLRYMLNKRTDAQFCAYSIPHPSENKMNLRLQSYGRGSHEVLEEGLKNVQTACDVLEKKFDDALKKFDQK